MTAPIETLSYEPKIREMPREERPRERMREYGPNHLNNTELIAILLRTGTQGENVLSLSSRLLSSFGGLAGLGRASFGELCREKGLSEAKASHLLAALELGRRFVSLAPQERPAITAPDDAANLVMAEMCHLQQEHLRILLLNTKHQVLSIQEIYVGNVNSSVVRAAEVFRPAIKDNATAIVLAHNHPSGDPTPSEADVAITRELVSSGQLLGIDVLDHLIIGDGGRWISLNSKGLGFK